MRRLFMVEWVDVFFEAGKLVDGSELVDGIHVFLIIIWCLVKLLKRFIPKSLSHYNIDYPKSILI